MSLSTSNKGITTIKWGTNNVAQGNMNTAIVESFTRRPLRERTKTPNNDGFTVRTTDVDDGEELTFNCVYDSAITWPAEHGIIGFINPRASANAVNCEVVEIEDVLTRKKEGTLTIKCERYAGINY